VVGGGDPFYLYMQAQVAAVCRSCFYQLCQLRVVQRSLTKDVLQSLVQAFVRCRLDYCNAILAGAAHGQIRRLQAVQNAAGRLVSGARRRDRVSPILHSLHWLPVRRRVTFKSAVIASVTTSLRHIYESSVSQWRMSVVAHDCGPRQLAAFYCLEFRPLLDGGLRVQRTCSVEQSATSLARKHVTGYI